VTKVQWATLALLVVAMGISFVDRGNLSVALSSIKRDLHVDERDLGLLSSAFFLSYTLMQLLVGKLLERFSVVWVYGIAFMVWSGATALTGVVHEMHFAGIAFSSFSVLFLLRLLLGCGESVSYPATALMITELFPETLRGTANSLIDAGSKIGPALGVMIGTTMLLAVGWRPMFLVLGVVSLLWLAPWFAITAKLPRSVRSVQLWSPSYLELGRKRSFWGAAMGHVGGNYTWSLFTSWLPYYFEKVSQVTPKQLILLSAAPFWILSVSSLTSGLLSDWLIARGLPAVRVRQATVCIGCLACAVCLLLAAFSHEPKISIAAVLGGSFALGFFSSNNWALAQLLAGQEAAAKWTSLQNLFANASAFTAAWLTGMLVARTGHFSAAFIVAGVLLVAGSLFYWFMIDARGPVIWPHVYEKETI
jgi:MFS family permease